MILLKDLLRQRLQRLAIDLHDDAERRQMRIHPVQREAFFDKEFVVRVLVEHDLREQAIDGHDGDLTGHLHAVIHDADIFPRLKLAVLEANLRVGEIILEALLRLLR